MDRDRRPNEAVLLLFPLLFVRDDEAEEEDEEADESMRGMLSLFREPVSVRREERPIFLDVERPGASGTEAVGELVDSNDDVEDRNDPDDEDAKALGRR